MTVSCIQTLSHCRRFLSSCDTQLELIFSLCLNWTSYDDKISLSGTADFYLFYCTRYVLYLLYLVVCILLNLRLNVNKYILYFILIYINYLKFSDYFCFFTILFFSIFAFNKIGCSTLSTLTSLFLFPLLFAYLLLPTLFTYSSLHYGTYSTLFCLRFWNLFPFIYLNSLFFSHLSYSTLYYTRPLTKSFLYFILYYVI